MNITVWTAKDCVQCMMTKKQFDKLNIKYEEKALADHPLSVEVFKAQGLTKAPIVTTDTKTWSGFRLDKIKSLSNYLKAQNK